MFPRPKQKAGRGSQRRTISFKKSGCAIQIAKKSLPLAKPGSKLKPDSKLIATIHAALDWQCEQIEWRKDGGQYVPLLASYLNGRRWEDERCPEDYKTEAELKEGAQKKRDDDDAHAEIKEMHDKFHANLNT